MEVLPSLPTLILIPLCWSYLYLLIALLETMRPYSVAVYFLPLAVSSFAISLPLAVRFRHSPFLRPNATLLVRLGVLAAPLMEIICRLLNFYCVRGLPTSEAVTLLNLSVVWTSVCSAGQRRRWPSKIQVAALFLVVGGVVMMKQPEFLFGSGGGDDVGIVTKSRNLNYFLAIVDSLLNAAYLIIYNFLTKSGVHFSVFLINYSLATIFAAAAASAVSFRSFVAFFTGLKKAPVGCVTLIGVFDVLVRISILMALERVDGDAVAFFTCLEIILSNVLGNFFLGQTLNPLGYIGVAMILAALLMVTLQDFISNRSAREEKDCRKDSELKESLLQ